MDIRETEVLGFEKCSNSKEGKIGAWWRKEDYVGIQPWGEYFYIYRSYTMFDREELVFIGKIDSIDTLKYVLSIVKI